MEETKNIIKKANSIIKNPDAIVDLYDLTFLWVNKKTAETYGYTPYEMIGKNVASFCFVKHGEPIDVALSFISSTFTHTMPIKTKEGEKVVRKMQYKIFKYERNPYLVTKFSS